MLLNASGAEVGLPEGQMGNSEVGHLCMGAGRVIYQDLNRIQHDIKTGNFSLNPVLVELFNTVKTSQRALHILGLLSEGGVHSHSDHFMAVLEFARKHDIKNIYVHAFLDGRDTAPQSAYAVLEKMSTWFENYGFGQIASICGRFYAMDRDKRFDRTQLAYDLLTEGLGYAATNALEGLRMAYERGESDEFVKPTVITNTDQPITIQDGDCVLFMNFRADRARQLSYALSHKNFTDFERKKFPNLEEFVTLAEYDAKLPAKVLYPPEQFPKVLGEVLQDNGLKQLRLAETEKYAHVTFFFNGGVEEPFNGEDRVLIPSPKVTTYDLKPEMSAYQVTEELTKAILAQSYDVIICNFANADMVGHSGNLSAACEAVKVLDHCLGKIVEALQAVDGSAFITSDHGNVEMMQNPITSLPHTAHTHEAVPLVYFGKQSIQFKRSMGKLADIAPTLLYSMGLSIPSVMTGEVLIECTEQ
ncbi:MAG TPA: 2,3-bisphosphoglycerate-independent phosphoglycerate mutase, partial [Gammaproteobacteria bacterium]|nr:2,3-bisphosphoglycerate-independent phosphoglycerate mutase [Gammaproteobacteria bacterium]